MTITHERRELSRPVAHKLAMARHTRQWTLARSAAEIGCSISSVHAYENGARVPSVAIAGNMARVYELDRESTIALLSEAVAHAGRKRPAKRDAAAKASASN